MNELEEYQQKFTETKWKFKPGVDMGPWFHLKDEALIIAGSDVRNKFVSVRPVSNTDTYFMVKEEDVPNYFEPIKTGGIQMKEIRTRYSKEAKLTKTATVITRKAFLDDLYDEAIEDPYEHASIKEAVDALTQKHSLTLDEILYLKKKAEDGKITFVEKNRGN